MKYEREKLCHREEIQNEFSLLIKYGIRGVEKLWYIILFFALALRIGLNKERSQCDLNPNHI